MTARADERALMLADLARSGLTERDAQAMRARPLTAKQVEKLTAGILKLPAYQLPYLTADGKPTGFYRLRMLATEGRGRPLRYWQPPSTLPGLYLPATLKGGWPAALKDAAVPLYVTEGEKKAAAGGAAGLATVGLGGVWAWRSKKKVGGQSLVIDDLDAIEWADRQVIIVFDSDVTEKLDVQAALRALAEELISRGARPQMIRLPAGRDGAKVGLDDFLLAERRPALEALEPQPLLGRLADELWRLNQELTYVEANEAIWRFKTRRLVSRAQLVDVAFANRTVAVVTQRGDVKQVSAAKEWLSWPMRRSVTRLTYAPGEAEALADGSLNLWQGWGCSPELGDCSPWDELLSYLFQGDPAARAWFERWCAYPLQHPGAKLYTAVVFFSLTHGLGKSLVGLTLGRIYGQNFTELSQAALHSTFNGWAAGKQFVLGDDVTGVDRREQADRLKAMVTQETILVNEKFQPQYAIPDCVNYFFTTNHPDAFQLERQDRRFFIHEANFAPMTAAFYARYDAWLRGDGPRHLFHKLLKLRLADFNPKAAAPTTDAKARMTDLSLSDLDALAGDLVSDPDQHLRVDGVPIPRDLFTLEELLNVADPMGARRTTKIALAKALRRAGLRPLPPTRATKGVVKLWAIRNQLTWENADAEARRAEYEKGRPALRMVEKKKEKF